MATVVEWVVATTAARARAAAAWMVAPVVERADMAVGLAAAAVMVAVTVVAEDRLEAVAAGAAKEAAAKLCRLLMPTKKRHTWTRSRV